MSILPGFEPDLPPIADDGAAGDEWYAPPLILSWLPPIAHAAIDHIREKSATTKQTPFWLYPDACRQVDEAI